MRFAQLARSAMSGMVAAMVLSSACAPKLIPGTEVQDTATNRKLLDQIERYRLAVEHRDVTAILAMVSPTYFDERGHPDDPSYHWNYARLAKELPEKLDKVKDVRLEITVRHITVKDDAARAAYFYTENYIATMPSGEVPEHTSDIDRMEFQRQGERWMITKGL
jgi:hypothetical protein